MLHGGQPFRAGHEKSQAASTVEHDAPRVPASAPELDKTVQTWHCCGRSQRAIARELGIDRRKIKRMINHPT